MRRDKEFTLEEVKDHARRTDCWVVIDNNVYDLTSFIDSHPGGEYVRVLYPSLSTGYSNSNYYGIT